MIHSTASPRWWTPRSPPPMPTLPADTCGLRTSLRQGFGTAGGPWANDDTHICHHADGGGSPRELNGDTGGRRIPSQRAPLHWFATATLSHGEIVTHLVNASQTLAASYKYDAYGNLVSQSGSLAGANVYRFSSKEWLATPGLYYYGYRWYAPNLQRWLNRDPIGEQGGINLYTFVYSNPIHYYDDFGNQPALPPGWAGPGRPYDPSLNPFAGPPPDTPWACGWRIEEEERARPANGMTDTWAHCTASCRISRECPGGRFTAWIGGDWINDPWWQSESQGSDPRDRRANRIGRDLSRSKCKSCEDLCTEAWNHGRLRF